MGQLLWCAVHLIEVFGLFWCLMVEHIPIVEFHTSKSALICICILKSCFLEKVWIFVLRAMTFVVLIYVRGWAKPRAIDPSSRHRGRPTTKSKVIVRKKKGKGKIWSWAPKGCPTPRQTGRMAVGHNFNSTNYDSQPNSTSHFVNTCPRHRNGIFSAFCWQAYKNIWSSPIVFHARSVERRANSPPIDNNWRRIHLSFNEWLRSWIQQALVRVSGYRSRGPGSIPGATRLAGLERSLLNLVSTTEELLVRKSSGSSLKKPRIR
jgi:hypothetical protein